MLTLANYGDKLMRIYQRRAQATAGRPLPCYFFDMQLIDRETVSMFVYGYGLAPIVVHIRLSADIGTFKHAMLKLIESAYEPLVKP